ncbi:beta-galactosidase [Martelella alba]|uniref:Beta-galactosidase n=1 Tax=Martelella alba TaxID=2590451 RepID=A0A506U474_9HYPH|nr:beta-galactosidase [Martelella alba]TPW29152.1 beta-galactosidase [Martelella alba]
MLGVCYYPEHWDEDWWADDARKMREMGIRYVRIAEFAWSRMEPEPGRYDWAWLDRAIDVLAAEGLKIVLGTPTAAAPKWLVDAHPDVLPVFADGRARGFGSRRHYTAASSTFRAETDRIVTAMAKRYGHHDAVVGWQIDNEFGGDDTVLLYGPEDAAGFRGWLTKRYQSVEALNRAWGNAFWSMEFRTIDEVIPPAGQVSDANPAALLDFWRYSSDSLADYCALQAGILRKYSPGRFITHNFMGFFHQFDHARLSESLDFCSWDSYPLGKVEHFPMADDERARWYNTSHPDFSAFHHELYRRLRNDRFWIMEQQPGPVNWAHWNPAPKAGMVRLWGWEALAHGAEVVSYFRWRQVPFAQEQMHAGLQRPDRQLSPGGHEVTQLGREIEAVGDLPPIKRARVAILLDYEAAWITTIELQGDDFNYKLLLHRWYEALRRHGINVDVLTPGRSLKGYDLVFIPSMPVVSEAAMDAFRQTDAHLVFGPRSGSKLANFEIPATLPPGPLQDVLPLKVAEVSSLRPGLKIPVAGEGLSGNVTRWLERIETDMAVLLATEDGLPVMVGNDRAHYLGAWAEPELLHAIFARLLDEHDIPRRELPEHVRMMTRGPVTIVFNYGPGAYEIETPAKRFLLGGKTVAACDLAIFEAV